MLNPFEPVHDYGSMLNRISFFNFVFALVAVALLRYDIRGIETVLAVVTVAAPVFGASINLGTVAAAAAVTLLSRMFKLHDLIERPLGIRKRFDVAAILLPLCAATGGTANAGVVRDIRRRRNELMRSTFYKYATLTAANVAIDKHFITMALEQWSWYWIVLEAAAISAMTGVVFLFFGPANVAAVLFMTTLGCGAALRALSVRCEEYALQEVEAILAEPTRKREVRTVFSAL